MEVDKNGNQKDYKHDDILVFNEKKQIMGLSKEAGVEQ
jgi:hypothetical protein